MTLLGSGVSRRGLLAMVAVLGTAGCARAQSDGEEPDDRYIAAIKADPMFSWAPPGNAIRGVTSAAMETRGPMPSKTSDVVVTYYVSDTAGLPKLIQRATDDSIALGYSKDGLHYVGQNNGQILIRLGIGTTYDKSGIYLHFQAPGQ